MIRIYKNGHYFLEKKKKKVWFLPRKHTIQVKMRSEQPKKE